MSIEVFSAILHKIYKERGRDNADVKKKDQLLERNSQLIEFIKEVKQIYYDRSNKNYGQFDRNKDSYPFQNMVQDYLTDNDNFIRFSHRAVDHFKHIINETTLATGGYMFFIHFRDQNEFIATLLLNEKSSHAIDENSLELTKNIHLDLEKIHVANFININRWNSGEEEYLSFTRGTKDISQYFLRFIGCTDQIDSISTSKQMKKAINDYLRDSDYSDERKKAIRISLDEYFNLKLRNKEPIELQTVSQLIDEQNAERFYGFASGEEYRIPDQFDGNRRYLKQIRKVFYKSDRIDFNYTYDFFYEHIDFDLENNKIVINDAPEGLINKLIETENESPTTE